jgi:ABC-type nickel/cobalt efflux system permease component RcnA
LNLTTTAPVGIALLGLVMGMRHATDPDHVIAVTTIVSRQHRLSTTSRIGVIWGLGHTLTVLAVGSLIIVFKIAIPARLGLAMEFAVAVLLILLGVGAVAGLSRQILGRIWRAAPVANGATGYSPVHVDDEYSHHHQHVHFGSHDHARVHVLEDAVAKRFALRRPLLRAFVVGLVHGLAGSAAIALLVLSAIPEPLWATVYLVIFCFGTILGMGLITTAIATPFMLTAERMVRMHQSLVASSGLLSFGFGLFLAYQLGISDHLFGAAPTWTPH